MTISTSLVPETGGGPAGKMSGTVNLFLVSVLGLFLEMMLIRWVGTEIRIFAYLQNAVLVVCFLGLGMGCFTCRQPASARQLLLPLLFLVVILALPRSRAAVGAVANWLSVLDDLGVWTQEYTTTPWRDALKVAVGLLLTFALLVVIWEIFLPLGRILGRLLDDHPHTIRAYSINVAGSLVGIWLFALLSAWYLSPAIWTVVFGMLLIPFLGQGRERLANLALLGAVIIGSWIAGYEPGARKVIWSPYQKLVLFEMGNQHPEYPGAYMITVNNATYQGILDLSPERLANDPRIPKEMHGLSQYDLPTLFRPGAGHVLIVGAGSGNDTAGALRGGARRVTAVEIDPAIVALGRQHHPERPYDDPRVRVVVDDARSFFATTDERYDLVVFGLLDSHTTTAMTNARLDHYVYTLESLRHVRSLLRDDGVVVLSFEVKKPFIADRMARALEDVFGRPPLAFRVPSSGSGWGGVLFVTGNHAVVGEALANNPRLARQVASWQAAEPMTFPHQTAITTDDWPYVYLQSARVPTLYGILAALMVGLVVYATARLRAPALMPARWDRSLWHFFFLGAAFMLLEVQNISKASVVLGSTWQVNGVIIAGVLCMILLSNLVVIAWPRLPLELTGYCLVGSCVALYFFDLSQLAFLPYAQKALLVGGLTTLPMFFSGIVFIRSFAVTKRKDLALGANLLGALAGGLLQSITFATGIKALLLVVAGLYLAALLARPRQAELAGQAKADAAPGTEPVGERTPPGSRTVAVPAT